MAWTYNDALTLDRDKLRLLVGDTDIADPQLTDSAADFILSMAAPGATLLHAAAASACRALAARYARRVDFDQGGLSLSASQRALRYQALALEFQKRVDDALKAEAGLGTVTSAKLGNPRVGGVPTADLETARANRPADPTEDL